MGKFPGLKNLTRKGETGMLGSSKTMPKGKGKTIHGEKEI